MTAPNDRCSAWVDRAHRMVSFLPREGYQERRFASHGEMLQCVIALGYSGYGIL